MGNSLPFRQKARPVYYATRIFIERELARLQLLGIISPENPGECLYASPIVIVAKKEGTLLMCVDYMQLKEMTIPDADPYHESMRSLHLCMEA